MNSYDDDSYEEREYDDEDGDESVEKNVWHLLLLINPGDEAGASLQFKAYQEEAEDQGDDEPLRLVGQVTDWRSSFEVESDDTRTVVEAITELVARWNLDIDWGGDPSDDEFHEDIDAAEIFSRAFDQLKPHGYTLWSREIEDDDNVAGWITSSRDDEDMLRLATLLHINIRRGDQMG